MESIIEPQPDPNPVPLCFVVPDLACDSHFHVFPADAAIPLASEPRYRPANTPISAYLAMAAPLQLQRAVLVQPTVYGIDNRLMLQTLEGRPQYRGVCAIGEETDDDELRELDQAGVCGIRVTSIPRGDVAHEHLRRAAHRIAGSGWHMQLYIGPGLLLKLARTLADLPVDVVLDHFAGLSAVHSAPCPERYALQELLESGKCWVKLSGAYRASLQDPPYADVTPLARWLFAVNPERLVWGSDWPHAHLRGRPMPNDGDLLNLLAHQMETPERLQRVLVDNPARLYRFGHLSQK